MRIPNGAKRFYETYLPFPKGGSQFSYEELAKDLSWKFSCESIVCFKKRYSKEDVLAFLGSEDIRVTRAMDRFVDTMMSVYTDRMDQKERSKNTKNVP